MLVLSRRKGEQIVVDAGDCKIQLRVLEAGNGRVRLGITAPPQVAIHRLEVWQRIKEWESEPEAAVEAPQC